MTEWSPPIETGLTGGLYVEEDLAQHVDDLSDAHQPGVYALKLSTPDSRDVVEERWARQYEVGVPEWVWHAVDHPTVLYVGAAKNVLERIHEHLDSPNRSASLCHVCPIHSVWDVWWFADADRAFERESGIAMEISNRYDGVFVRQA